MLSLKRSAKGLFRLDGQADTRTFGDGCREFYNPAWDRMQPLDQLDAASRDMRGAYIRAVIEAAAGARLKDREGRLQADYRPRLRLFS